MQDYEFSAVAPSIRRISYVNLDDEDMGPVTSATTDQGNNNNGGEKRPILPVVLAGAGGLCGLGVGGAAGEEDARGQGSNG